MSAGPRSCNRKQLEAMNVDRTCARRFGGETRNMEQLFFGKFDTKSPLDLGSPAKPVTGPKLDTLRSGPLLIALDVCHS